MRSRLHKRYVKNPSSTPRSNPPLFTDLLEFVGPGFAAFAATRFGTRIATTQIAKLKPSLSKHAGAGISIGAFLAAWFFGHKVKFLAKHHTPIVVGAAIAALQSLIQLYIPTMGWMVSDATPELDAAATTSALAPATVSRTQLQPVDDDPNEYTYDDSYDAGRYSKPGKPPPGQSPPIMAPNAVSDDMADMTIDDAIGTANLGVFSN